jgi:hypothetical protein
MRARDRRQRASHELGISDQRYEFLRFTLQKVSELTDRDTRVRETPKRELWSPREARTRRREAKATNIDERAAAATSLQLQTHHHHQEEIAVEE